MLELLPKPPHCIPCPLYGNGQGFSVLEGSGQNRVMTIAEALGENEERDHLPLRPNGAAGSIYQRAIRDLRLKRNDFTITNIVRCRPPGNDLKGMPWEQAAIHHCSKYLDDAVAQYQPKAILALGDIAMRELTDRVGILTYRGFIAPSKYGIPVIPTYHPMLIGYGAWHLFGVFLHDIELAVRVARDGPPRQVETHYELVPSVDDVRRFYLWLCSRPTVPINYDIETAAILGEKEPEDWAKKRIIQIQFSATPGRAIVLPWDGDGPYSNLARSILALPNPKWGWNSRESDDIALRAHDCDLNGELHDLMVAWGHLQPDFAGGGENAEVSGGGDKGIVARLMGLQAAASFYCPEIEPWKVKITSIEQLRWYGARDADINGRCGRGIFASLERQGLMAGYMQHKFRLRKVLDDLGRRGLPVDRERQADTRRYALSEAQRLRNALQDAVPTEIRGIHPAAGYKSISGKVTVEGREGKVPLKELIAAYDPANPPLLHFSNFSGHLVQETFERDEKVTVQVSQQVAITSDGQMYGGDLEINQSSGVQRWAVRKLFNPSAQQLLAYIKHMGYRVPTKIDDPSKETTGALELAKLTKETGDPVLKLTEEYKKFATLASRYVGKEVKRNGEIVVVGDWVPGPDGRVHGTFGWGTGSGQTTCHTPNEQQFPEHGPLAKRAKEMIVAQPGHTFVKIDMRGFHSRMIGFLAEDKAYYDLADKDVHSYISAHFLNLPDAPYLLDMDDDELSAYLKMIKRDHEYVRNYKVKRVVHGSQFGLGINKLYRMNSDSFDPTPERAAEMLGTRFWQWDAKRQQDEISRLGRAEATRLRGLMPQLFPKAFSDYPKWVENQIRHVTPCHLRTRFGHIRWFWDYDLQKATAYRPSNCSHCHFQDALIRLDDGGALERYEAVNYTHDALWLHPLTERVAECIEVVQFELERPSYVLENVLGPFQCNSDAEVGLDLAHMKGWKGV